MNDKLINDANKWYSKRDLLLVLKKFNVISKEKYLEVFRNYTI